MSWVDKIKAMLAKAESTDSEQEAETFYSKAQELMTKHSIDEAMLASRGLSSEYVIMKRISIPGPYAKAKSTLFAAIAETNFCKVVLNGNLRQGSQAVEIVGHESDIFSVQMLFESLSSFAVGELTKAEVPPLTSTKSYRASWMHGYAQRVWQRLEETQKQTKQDSEPGTGLVLVDREKKVADRAAEVWPRVRSTTVSVANAEGYNGGKAAANRANLGRPVGGARAAISA